MLHDRDPFPADFDGRRLDDLFSREDLHVVTSDGNLDRIAVDKDVDGVTALGSDLYLTTNGTFDAGGVLSGDGNDVFSCDGAATIPEVAPRRNTAG